MKVIQYYYQGIPLQEWWLNNPSIWFSHKNLEPCEIKHINMNMFIKMITKRELEFYDNDIQSIILNKLFINKVIFMDQYLRHPPHENPNKMCYELVKLFLPEYKWMFEPVYDVFVLLVLRHYNDYRCVSIIKQLIHNYLLKKKPVPPVYYKFLNVSLQKLIKFNPLCMEVCCKNEKYYITKSLEEILDHTSPSLNTTYTNETSFKMSKNINDNRKSLNHLYIPFNKEKITIQDMLDHIENTIKDWCLMNNMIYEDYKNTIVISLSGGVDSMVLSYLCSILSKKCLWSIECVHISYGNNKNDICNKEIEFLKYWCSNILNCNLYIRHIYEIKRNRNKKWREIYENITHNIRFQSYSTLGNGNKNPILLGHNMDDTIENAFRNMSQKIHFNNILGMNDVEYIDNNITLVRPFLNIPKSAIVGCSHYLNIPYLKDSTPPWSQRGRLRDKLMKQIHNFDENMIEGMYTFIKQSINHSKIYKQQIYKWFNTLDKTTLNIPINDTTFKNYYDNISFWIDLWFYFKLPYRPSNKSFQNIINHIKYSKKTKFNITLNKHFVIVKTSNGILKLIQQF
mgnify:CR=1 FL=1